MIKEYLKVYSCIGFLICLLNSFVFAQTDEFSLITPNRYAPASKTTLSEFDTLHTAITSCDTVRRSVYNAELDGYFAGTTRKTIRDTLNTKYYITEHAALYFTPVIKATDTIKTRIRGLYIWFAEGTEVKNAADNFKIKVYNGELKDAPQAALYEKSLNATYFPNWAPGTEPGNTWNNQDRNLIRIDTTVNLSGYFGVALETANAIGDDYLAFYYTRNNDPDNLCPNYNNRWRIFLQDSARSPYMWVAPSRLNRSGLRLPYFIPILEDYDSASAVIGRPEFQTPVIFQVLHTSYSHYTQVLSYSMKLPDNLPQVDGQILNLNGSPVWQGKLEKEGNISCNLAAGTYLVVAKTKNYLDAKRFLVSY